MVGAPLNLRQSLKDPFPQNWVNVLPCSTPKLGFEALVAPESPSKQKNVAIYQFGTYFYHLLAYSCSKDTGPREGLPVDKARCTNAGFNLLAIENGRFSHCHGSGQLASCLEALPQNFSMPGRQAPPNTRISWSSAKR